jgi:hypothetical protein
MDAEFLDRMSLISKRVRAVLEESEYLKSIIAQRIARKAEKPTEDEDQGEEKEEDEEEDDDGEEEDDDHEEDEEDGEEKDEEDGEEDDEEDEDEEDEEEEEEEVADNDYSACWNCFNGRGSFFGRRRF